MIEDANTLTCKRTARGLPLKRLTPRNGKDTNKEVIIRKGETLGTAWTLSLAVTTFDAIRFKSRCFDIITNQ